MKSDTIIFANPDNLKEKTMQEILNSVYDSLQERGYDPVGQIVGYIMSGDPSYITSYNNSRNKIRQIERDELVEAMLKNFLNK